MASRRKDPGQLERMQSIRNERFALMEGLARLPEDTVFFTQITMEAAEDPEFLDAMRRAHIRGALVGVEAVTPEGLKDVYKDFNDSGEALVDRLKQFRSHGIHVLGSFIFGLPSDRAKYLRRDVVGRQTIGRDLCAVRDAHAVPRNARFRGVGEESWRRSPRVGGVPISRHWLIPQGDRPEGLYGPSGHGRGRDPGSDPGRMGSVLFAAKHLGAFARIRVQC